MAARVTSLAAAGRPYNLRARNAVSESDIQKHIVKQLRAYMPREVWWTCSLSGVRLNPAVAAEAKRMGMEKGAPDLSFIFADGVTRYVEVKTPEGDLTPEQRRLALILSGLGQFRVVRSWDDMQAVLDVWLALYGLRLLTDAEAVRQGRLS